MAGITGWLEDHLIPCTVKSFTGLDCPGCGMQRAFVCLLRGDILDSFRLYPALIPMLLTFSVLFAGLKWDFPYRITLLKGLYFLTVGIMVTAYVIKIVNHQLI